MKRDFLKNLGLEDDVIDKIMDENGNDINKAKNSNAVELENLKKENETLKSDNESLKAKSTEAADKYKDYEELVKFKTEYMEKVETSKRTDWLKANGCKHPDLIAKTFDWENAKWNEESKTFEGMDEALKSAKENYKDLFVVETQPDVDKGKNRTGGTGSDFFETYKAEHPELEF